MLMLQIHSRIPIKLSDKCCALYYHIFIEHLIFSFEKSKSRLGVKDKAAGGPSSLLWWQQLCNYDIHLSLGNTWMTGYKDKLRVKFFPTGAIM